MRTIFGMVACCLTLWGIVIYFLVSGIAHAADGGISLDTTRVIYPAGSKSVTLRVRNSDANSSYLVQPSVSESLDENVRQSPEFVISPSIFRLKKNGEGVIKIMAVAPEHLKKDRESLYWVNVKAIPSSHKVDFNSGNDVSGGVKIAVGNTIKLLYRPEGLTGSPRAGAEKLRFSKDSTGKLTVRNDSPYYISIGSLKINGTAVKSKHMMMVAPYSDFLFDDVTLSYEIKDVSWKAINDNGGLDEFHYEK